MDEATRFRRTIRDHYKKSKRDLPWRNTTNPYHIFVSEVMLQQTQVGRVLKKYPTFISTLPTFKHLAEAPTRKLLQLWQGLGYNRRALYLRRSSKIIIEQYKGALPSDPELLKKLPGIGPATSCSIATFAFNIPTVFIETNIRRVFIHHFFNEKERISDKSILALVEKTLDRKNPRVWYFALMDYGSLLGKSIQVNPNRRSASYTKQPKFEGSNRQVRGQIIKLITLESSARSIDLYKLSFPKAMIAKNIARLIAEGFIFENKGVYDIVR